MCVYAYLFSTDVGMSSWETPLQWSDELFVCHHNIFYYDIILIHVKCHEYVIKTLSLNNCSLGRVYPRDSNTKQSADFGANVMLLKVKIEKENLI